MITLTSPLLKRSFAYHKVIVSTVQVGSRGIRVRANDDLCYAVEILAVHPVLSTVQGIDTSLQIPDAENGIYSNGKKWYQLALRRL